MYLDPDAFRYRVPVVVKGGPATPEVKTLPKHKKNPDVGEKKTVFASNILLDQEDALSFEDNEEVRLWMFMPLLYFISLFIVDHVDGLG
jgi:hypothetical protein